MTKRTDTEDIRTDIRAIIESERTLAAAHLTLDLEVIDRLLHEDYVILQPDGRFETKSDLLASYRSGDRAWEMAQVGDLAVTIHGDTAVARGRWRARGRNREAHFDYAARFLSIWIRQAGRWRNLTYQAVEAPAEGFPDP